MATRQQYTLVLLGDVMLGRLVDALLPTSIARLSPHTDPETAARTVDTYILNRNPELRSYNYASPWGNAVRTIRDADFVLANLETALTRSEKPWPAKAFNYRSHPENVRCLTKVGMNGGRGYVSLANNHTLDWCVEGLHATSQALADADIRFAGAGRTSDEAARPATLDVGSGPMIKCWSFADHPSEWKDMDLFNFIDYSDRCKERIKRHILGSVAPSDRRFLKVVSMHWGPNYRWHPTQEIIDLAHFMIDECGVDLIHGHSSHHIQGLEIYKGKLIVYGCGDFVDDYAVNITFRNDLSALWRVTATEQSITKLELFPNRIQKFAAHLLDKDDVDHAWVDSKFRELCARFGTKVEKELGSHGQLIVDVAGQV
jgi:poly-gamma-glutamate capsule biosynthesis protein CapA/YwtB (metallophosphatase superfamily)